MAKTTWPRLHLSFGDRADRVHADKQGAGMTRQRDGSDRREFSLDRGAGARGRRDWSALPLRRRNVIGLLGAGVLWGGLGLRPAAAEGAPMTPAVPAPTPDPASGTITAHGVATLGALSYPADFSQLAYVNPDAPKGGEFSMAWTGGFDSFNPFSIKGRPEILSSIMLESMLEGTADTVGEAYCLLCESFEYPPSKDWVIFTLREGITFSDGTPMTAEDALFSYETLRDKGLSSFRNVIAQQVAKAEVLDARRIRYTFTPNYPRRDIIQTVGGLPVLSKAQFTREKLDLEESFATALIGSGPYRFASARDGRSAIWERNPEYWGKALPIKRGRDNYDRVRIEYFGDYNSAFEAFKAGNYTFRIEASSIKWATGYDFAAYTSGKVVKAQPHDGNVASGQGFLINMRHARFQDLRVRQALNLMFNFEWANETLFYGIYERVNSIWENSELAASGVPSPQELELLRPLAGDLPEGILTEPAVMAPVSGKRQLDRRNMRAAADLLDAAGWHAGDDGMRRDAQGQSLRVVFLNDQQSFDRVINPYVENLRALGVDAVNQRVDNAEYENRRGNHDFDIITGHVGQGLIPGADMQQYFGSKSVGDIFNAMGLANPAIDRLIRLVEEAQTHEQLTVRVHALDRALRALRFWVPQWYKATYTLAYYDMYRYPDPLPPYGLGQMDFWWIDADKEKALRDAGAF